MKGFIVTGSAVTGATAGISLSRGFAVPMLQRVHPIFNRTAAFLDAAGFVDGALALAGGAAGTGVGKWVAKQVKAK